jgi:hypothetical protein
MMGQTVSLRNLEEEPPRIKEKYRNNDALFLFCSFFLVALPSIFLG